MRKRLLQLDKKDLHSKHWCMGQCDIGAWDEVASNLQRGQPLLLDLTSVEEDKCCLVVADDIKEVELWRLPEMLLK
jgi:hypothetical protein